MRLWSGALLVLSILPPGSSAAGEHLVSPQQVEATLTAAAAARQRNISTLERTLSTPAAVEAAARVGADLDRVRGLLPTLTDDEARDLAARAAALDTDPAAGVLGTLTDLVVLVLLVLLVLFVARELD